MNENINVYIVYEWHLLDFTYLFIFLLLFLMGIGVVDFRLWRV